MLVYNDNYELPKHLIGLDDLATINKTKNKFEGSSIQSREDEYLCMDNEESIITDTDDIKSIIEKADIYLKQANLING